jgi:hypothetical protein
MIKWIREKFKGKLDRKYRKLVRQVEQLDHEARRIKRQRQRLIAQLKLMNVVGRIIGYRGERAIFGKGKE